VLKTLPVQAGKDHMTGLPAVRPGPHHQMDHQDDAELARLLEISRAFKVPATAYHAFHIMSQLLSA
jgi:hypothetical protein